MPWQADAQHSVEDFFEEITGDAVQTLTAISK